ncbi:hypothetical protein B1B_17471, partial [mine drainage metagenome]
AFRELLPNMTSLAAASFFGAAGAALAASVGLEFLGIGNPNTVAWGNLLYWAEQDNALLSKQILLLLAARSCHRDLGRVVRLHQLWH